MPALKILVYDDNPDFGGHQIMACQGIEALSADPSIEIVCMLNPANRQLARRLAGFRALKPAGNFKELNIDRVLCIQGDLAQSVRGIRAARRAGVECVGYLALPHRLADMGARLGALRDLVHRNLANAPDRFIVISEGMKHLLVGRGCTRPVDVVPNGIPAPAFSKAQGPRPNTATIGLLGRIEFKQKRQDFMVRAFRAHPGIFGDCQLLIAGDGPDGKRLRDMVVGNENIELLPWQNDPDAFFQRIDFLAIPSRYEGVPLVMLEALAHGLALAEAFSRVRKTLGSKIDVLRQRVRTEHSLEAFRTAFARAVLK
jgi:glycosyltransferase involved in cell wall biosynthesis